MHAGTAPRHQGTFHVPHCLLFYYFCTNLVSISPSSSDAIPRISIHLALVLQVINERSARTRALVGVTTERDIRKWSGSDEVRDLLDINNKMYVPAAPLASR